MTAHHWYRELFVVVLEGLVDTISYDDFINIWYLHIRREKEKERELSVIVSLQQIHTSKINAWSQLYGKLWSVALIWNWFQQQNFSSAACSFYMHVKLWRFIIWNATETCTCICVSFSLKSRTERSFQFDFLSTHFLSLAFSNKLAIMIMLHFIHSILWFLKWLNEQKWLYLHQIRWSTLEV